ncbi:hypothetical protein BHE74_00039925 [Ensete ventricosum]|nr:hypothetical protein BHE74_00039925 [Ensete ventricosum]
MMTRPIKGLNRPQGCRSYQKDAWSDLDVFAHYLSPVAPNGVARIDLEIDACGLEVLVPPIAASRTPPPPCVCFRSPPPAAPPLLRPS